MVGRRAAGTGGMQQTRTMMTRTGGIGFTRVCGGSALDHEDGLAPVGYPLSTGRLLTRSSSGGLTQLMRRLILGRASHLDAVSGYPCQT